MRRNCFSIGIVCLFLIVSFTQGCEMLGFYTVKVTNRTSSDATFTMDSDTTQTLIPNQYVNISRVTSGEHTWHATWTDSNGRSRSDSGTIDVDSNMEMVIAVDGVHIQ
ncbi:hypothetical protein H8E77_25785 [bacterium]|nr:hypothetical protein [bacterium]